MRTIVGVVLAVMFIGFAGCSREIDPPSAVSSLPRRPEVPRFLTPTVDDNSVGLSWSVNNPSRIRRYRIYSADSATMSYVELRDSTSASSFMVTGLTNGRRYFFRVSAVDSVSNVEGEMSLPTSAVPGIFSMQIENGHEVTRNRTALIQLTAPAGTALVLLSEDASFSSTAWISYAPAVPFTFSDSDGLKQVYARFQFTDGITSSNAVTDDIILDRRALISSVDVEPAGTILAPGAVVHFALDAGETNGEAFVEIDGFGIVPLNDLGSNGDNAAGNGIYEADFTLPPSLELESAVVIGQFTDAAGNEASELVSDNTLTVLVPPDEVTLSGHPVSSSAIELEWSVSNIASFSHYRVTRSDYLGPITDTNLFNATFVTLVTITGQSSATYQDSDLNESKLYHYRVWVTDTRGASRGSDFVSVATLPNAPPDPIVLAATLGADTLEVQLSWSASVAADLESYRIVRDTNPAVDSTRVIRILTDGITTSYADRVPARGTYYYRVYVFDLQGAGAGSNTVTVIR